ncbi:MAG: DUF4315 family protein [Lachnospiraceae bacterium]|nr:DUF4315 family protein [Lachnospiraceae bacterium]
MAESKFEKLDRMRADIQRDRERVARMLEQIKQKEAKLKEAEATVILDEVGSYKMTPEQLTDFLKLIASGKLEAVMGNHNTIADTKTPIVPDDDEDENDETEDNEDEEDY